MGYTDKEIVTYVYMTFAALTTIIAILWAFEFSYTFNMRVLFIVLTACKFVSIVVHIVMSAYERASAKTDQFNKMYNSLMTKVNDELRYASEFIPIKVMEKKWGIKK